MQENYWEVNFPETTHLASPTPISATLNDHESLSNLIKNSLASRSAAQKLKQDPVLFITIEVLREET